MVDDDFTRITRSTGDVSSKTLEVVKAEQSKVKIKASKIKSNKDVGLIVENALEPDL